MKICWDTLDGVRLTKNGFFRKGSDSYVYKESCTKCGMSYLGIKDSSSKFCSLSCVNKGRVFSVEVRKKMSETKKGKNNPMYGKTHSFEIRKKMSENSPDRTGVLNSNYKGGLYIKGIVRYEAYKDKLSPYEDIRKQDGTEILEAKCTYCGRWYTPRYVEVRSRLDIINRLNHGECRLYCSENCKQACPTFGKQKYPKGFKRATSREVSTYLRQMVLERDNWTCQICGKTIEDAQLHCHHMDPATQNPMFQNDMDSCITLCKVCHKMVHSRVGCRYVDLRCKTKKE